MPENRVTRSAWDCRGKAGAYKACGISAESVKGKRVLDIWYNAGYDTFYLNALGALETAGLEPHMFYLHAMFLNAVYERSGVSFFNAGWENLDGDYLGNFDLVNCLGLIYHVKEPMGILRSTGFKDDSMRLKADCGSRNPKNPRLTVEGYPAGARAWFVATRA